MPTELLQKIILQRATYQGLSSAEALKRRITYGPNSLPATRRTAWPKRLANIFTEPMMLLLLSAAAVYFFIGDSLETAILLLSIIPISLMEFFQQQRTDDAIRELDKLLVQYCQTYRDNKLIKLETKDLVPGDLVYLTAGDKIPADGILLNSPGAMIDESILTGESVAVAKSHLPDGPGVPNDEHKLWQGTLIVQGEGYMLVLETGANTAYGKLGDLLEKIVQRSTPLQQKIHSLVKMVAAVAILAALATGLTLALRHDWMEGLLGGLTVAMALIPEEFPVVFSVFLIMGVRRMTRQNALVREMAMIETLGSATVICTDKTGTLTEGKMKLEQIYYRDKLVDLAAHKPTTELQPLVQAALLSLEQIAIDPIEVAIQQFAGQIKIDVPRLYQTHTLIQDGSFDSNTKLVHHLWKNQTGTCVQYTAGAPESILRSSRLSSTEKNKMEKTCAQMMNNGYRVIAVARRPCGTGEKIALNNLEPIGLLALSDPPRPGVKEAIAICQNAGLRIIMITGDNKLTAHHIAETVGLKHNEEMIDGEKLEKLSPAALAETIKRHSIFTRVRPEQKYLIVESLQQTGEVVAMTGDGVNDAPALKKADIGVAMGQKGTEVARAAAGMVLLDDNFTTIVNAVREGRRIYDNLRQAFVFLFTFHLPIIGLAVIPVGLGQPMIFLPIHVIFLELICDPASVLGFEREQTRRGLMTEPPRSPQEPMIGARLWMQIIIRGLGILALSFGFYYYFTVILNQPDLGRTMAFGSLVVSQIFLILLTREWQQVKSNRLLLFISALTLAVLSLILLVEPLRQIFRLAILNDQQIGLMVVLPPIIMGLLSRIKKTSKSAAL